MSEELKTKKASNNSSDDHANLTTRSEGLTVETNQVSRALKEEIKEKEQMKKALEAEHKRFNDVLETLPVYLVLLTPDYHVPFANRYFRERFGESHGKRCFEYLFERTEPCEICETYTVLKTMSPHRWEWNGPDGRDYDIYDFPFTDTDGSTLILEMGIDITDRKEAEEALRKSEEKYRSMMDSFTDPLYICSHDFKVEYMNPAMIRRNGRDATGKKCFKTIHGLDSKCDWCTFDEVTRGEQSEINIKSPIDNRNYRVTNMPIHNQDKTISKMSVLRDITDYLQALREKEKVQAQLVQSQKMESIALLAGGIAHDFNNMLNVILGYGEILLAQVHKSDPLHESINEIMEAAKHSAELTGQLLAFSRRQTLQPKILDLNDVLKNLDNMLRRLIGEDIELSILLAEGLKNVEADPGQIEQVIMNLAINARDAMPQGGKLTIETANVELDEQYVNMHLGVKPGRYVMLAMTDTGSGMDEETREKIFEPFFTTKHNKGGTGLGLSTIYGIIKQSNGNIWVYSEPGQGTTFKIYLPETIGELSEKEVPKDAIKIDGSGEKILVVEDEPSLRKLCAKILKSLNYKVTVAANGGEALLLIEEEKLHFDLIISDVVMPEMSGKVLTDRLKKTIPDLKVLYMSGYTPNAIVHHGVLDSGTKFIQKPFTTEKLGKAIREILSESRDITQ